MKKQKKKYQKLSQIKMRNELTKIAQDTNFFLKNLLLNKKDQT